MLQVIRELEKRYGAYAFGVIVVIVLGAVLLWPAARLYAGAVTTSANLEKAAESLERTSVALQATAETFERIAPWIALNKQALRSKP